MNWPTGYEACFFHTLMQVMLLTETRGRSPAFAHSVVPLFTRFVSLTNNLRPAQSDLVLANVPLCFAGKTTLVRIDLWDLPLRCSSR